MKILTSKSESGQERTRRDRAFGKEAGRRFGKGTISTCYQHGSSLEWRFVVRLPSGVEVEARTRASALAAAARKKRS